MTSLLVIDDLLSLISKAKGTKYVEVRYQSRTTNEVNFSNGELEGFAALKILAVVSESL